MLCCVVKLCCSFRVLQIIDYIDYMLVATLIQNIAIFLTSVFFLLCATPLTTARQTNILTRQVLLYSTHL